MRTSRTRLLGSAALRLAFDSHLADSLARAAFRLRQGLVLPSGGDYREGKQAAKGLFPQPVSP